MGEVIQSGPPPQWKVCFDSSRRMWRIETRDGRKVYLHRNHTRYFALKQAWEMYRSEREDQGPEDA